MLRTWGHLNCSLSRQSQDRGELGRILIVEDDLEIRTALAMLLLDEGYQVLSCEDGRQALDLLATTDSVPDAIILDLRLPVMDGWEFRARQRADPALSGIPVFAISADGSSQAAAIHADAYLQKPFNPADLLVKLERILLERENHQIKARLARNQRLTAIGTVAAGVAHEIKNPLTFVMANLHVAADTLMRMSSDLSVVRELEELIGEARVGLDRISVIVKDLGLLARAPDEQLAPIALYGAVDAAIRMAAHHIRRGARLVREYRDAPFVVGDQARLTQVFLNLLVNACQALPDRRPGNEITVKVRCSGANALVEIEDNGTGIDPLLQPRIFEPFFSTKPATEGAGLGLSICRDLVASQGGRIEFDSQPGRGSRFRVLLPIAQATQAEQ